jgi:hypothetical protein
MYADFNVIINELKHFTLVFYSINVLIEWMFLHAYSLSTQDQSFNSRDIAYVDILFVSLGLYISA